MGTDDPDRELAFRTKFTATDAARVAFTTPPVRLTRARSRILLAATAAWCRDLQFPTVRDIGAATGLRSPSTVTGGFGRLIDIQATVIRLEWQRIEQGWMEVPADRRPSWLAQHGCELGALDPTCVRLPGLVCSAVLGADVVRPRPAPGLLAPLHALAALADVAVGPSDLRARGQVAAAPPALPGPSAADADLATPA